jgi:hypothetical protein
VRPTGINERAGLSEPHRRRRRQTDTDLAGTARGLVRHHLARALRRHCQRTIFTIVEREPAAKVWYGRSREEGWR